MTPTTNAGRALLDDLAPIEAWRDSVMRASQQSVRDSFARDVAAIEAEAAEAARAEVAAKVRALPSGCHSHSGLSCGNDWFDGYCSLVDGHAVLAILEAAPKEDAS